MTVNHVLRLVDKWKYEYKPGLQIGPNELGYFSYIHDYICEVLNISYSTNNTTIMDDAAKWYPSHPLIICAQSNHLSFFKMRQIIHGMNYGK